MSIVQLINNEDTPLEEKIISYYTRDLPFPLIELRAIVHCKYKHPEAPEAAYTWVLEDRYIDQKSRFTSEAAPWILLEAAQNNINK